LVNNKFIAKSVGEIILKIGQHVAKLEAKIRGNFFLFPDMV